MPSRFTAPFVLLDDARDANAAPARLYCNPVDVVVARSLGDVERALQAIEGAKTRGLHAAGFIAYEAGHIFEPRLRAPVIAHGLPLLWFGLFDRFEQIAPLDVAARLPDPAGGWAGAPVSAIDYHAYAVSLARIKSLIADGDIYQANLTFGCDVAVAGDPLALYAGLRARSRAGYGGVVATGDHWLLSLSPELFFAVHDGKITTRPMKGTVARAGDDAHEIVSLTGDPKQLAENLMIVDLLRNDLSRVAEPGSVAVPDLFAVETYPTLHQMTSTVTATLRPGLGAIDVVRAIYPCGSITGAPKIRAMEVINEVEAAPRGAYTGSLGRIDANGNAAFNVAIRTLDLADGAKRARMGLGGGIVADSETASEWAEANAKGAFVADPRMCDLIETMRFDPGEGIALIERHLARMHDSAQALGFTFDRHAARNELQAATFRLRSPRRIRLLLSRGGRFAVEILALPRAPIEPVTVAIAPLGVARGDFRLCHKTTDRAFYNAARAKVGTFEVALTDAEGFLTEGSFTSIFVHRGARLLTPPLSRGLLPGVLRGELIDRQMAVEADLRANDLAAGFYIGNACRGLIAAELVRSQP